MTEDFAYRAKVLITQRRYQDAVRLCRRGLLTDPSRVEGRLVLGMALLAMRRFEEVRSEMVALLKSRPEDHLAHRLLGAAYLKAGDLVRAEEELLTAKNLAPTDPVVPGLLEELSEQRDADPLPGTGGRHWPDSALLRTIPGEPPAFDSTSEAQDSQGSRGPSVCDDVFGEMTISQDAQPGVLAVPPSPLRFVTKVLPPGDAERVRHDAAAGEESLPASTGSVGQPDGPSDIEALAQTLGGPAVSARGAIAMEATETPERPRDAPEPQAPAPAPLAKGGVRSWPTVEPATVTPVMPALVRAAARLAAASAKPASQPAIESPTGWPKVSSNPEIHDIDTRSYADVSGEARSRATFAQAARAPSLVEPSPALLISQAKFAEAVSEVSEVSEISGVSESSDAQGAAAVPESTASEISERATLRQRSERDGAAAVRAPDLLELPVLEGGSSDADEEEDDATVTEVPQSYREGSAPRQQASKPPTNPSASGAVSNEPPGGPTVMERLGSAPTVLARTGDTVDPAQRELGPLPTAQPVLARAKSPAPEPRESDGRQLLVTPPATISIEAGESSRRESSQSPPSFLDEPGPTHRAGARSSRSSDPAVPLPLPAPAPPHLAAALGRITIPVIDADGKAPPPMHQPKPALGGLPRSMPTVELDESRDIIELVQKAGPAVADEPFALSPKLSGEAPWVGAAGKPIAAPPKAEPAALASRAPVLVPPPQLPPEVAHAAFDPLDHPLSPDDFASSVSRAAGEVREAIDADPGSFGPLESLTGSAENVPYLGPEDLISGSEVVQMPGKSAGRSDPLDVPFSPDDFSYPKPPRPDQSPLDEPLSPDDFSYHRLSDDQQLESLNDEPPRNEESPLRPAQGPARPIAGVGPKLVVPTDQVRELQRLVPTPPVPTPALPDSSLDEPLRPSEFGSEPAPTQRPASRKRSREPAPPRPAGKKAPARIVKRAGRPPVRVPGTSLPRERSITLGRTLPYVVTAVALVTLVVIAVWAGMRWRAHRQRTEKMARAELAEAMGDYASLRQALALYRELAQEAPDGREHVARLARTYGSLAFEFGLAEDKNLAQQTLTRLQSLGPSDPALAHVEAAARAYLLVSEGQLDQAETLLGPITAPDPDVTYLRGRIRLLRGDFAGAAGLLSRPQASWVRQSCALVEAKFGASPTGRDWSDLLDQLQLPAMWRQHVGMHLLRARLSAVSPGLQRNAVDEIRVLSQPALMNKAAPSERAWVHLLKAMLAIQGAIDGGTSEAERELLLVRNERPTHDLSFRLELARVLRRLDRVEEARQELVQIGPAVPPLIRADALLLLAESYLDLNDLESAERTLAKTVQNGRWHLLKGRHLLALRQWNDAREQFVAAKRDSPELAFDADLQLSRVSLSMGEESRAEEIVRDLSNSHPDSVEVHLLLGDTVLVRHRMEDALREYQEAVRLEPNGTEARLRIARLERWRGNVAAARSELGDLLTRDPSNVAAFLMLASLEGSQGNTEEARRKFEAARSVAQGSMPGALAIAEAELRLYEGQLDDAQRLVDQARTVGARETDIQYVRGRLLLRKYQIDGEEGAKALLLRASEVVKGDPVRHAELARAYLLLRSRNGDSASAAARQSAEAALEIDANLPEALAVMAMITMDSDNVGAASQPLGRAERSLDHRSRDQNVRGFVLMARGRFEYENGNAQEAIRRLEQALQSDRNLAEAHYFVGMANEQLGRIRDACDAFTRLLELDGQSADATEARGLQRGLRCR